MIKNLHDINIIKMSKKFLHLVCRQIKVYTTYHQPVMLCGLPLCTVGSLRDSAVHPSLTFPAQLSVLGHKWGPINVLRTCPG